MTANIDDIVLAGGREGFVAAWGQNGERHEEGDEAPAIDGHRSYLIAMLEGGYLHVQEGMIMDWLEHAPALALPVFDKWGQLVDCGPAAVGSQP